MSLSVYILVNKGDASYALRACNSIKCIANEIILGFEDKEEMNLFTLDDASIRKYLIPFKGSFSKMRNEMIQKCSGEWVFGLDSDEIIAYPKELKRKMDDSRVDAIEILRLNFLDGEFQYAFSPDWCRRIHRNRENIKFKGKIHEVLQGYQNKKRIKTAILIHDKSWERQKEQDIRYKSLGAE